MDERHPAPGTQSTLPGLASPEQQMRQRVLTRALETLRIVGPLSARDLAARLTPLDPRINKHVVNSVLFREGKALVRHDQASARFRIR
jgi:hypothetical protein